MSCFRKSPKSEYSPRDEFEKYLNVMNDGEQKTYIDQRLLGQIVWYDKSSIDSQKVFKRWSNVSMLAGISIPVLSVLSANLGFDKVFQVIVAVIGAVSAIASSKISQNRSIDLWTSYRSNCEILKSNLHRYFSKTCEFYNMSDEEAFNLLVVTSEEYLVKEFLTWTEANTPRKNEENQSPELSSTNS